jgi:uncharacterized surface protein with fasciclin (FAS1) repeats
MKSFRISFVAVLVFALLFTAAPVARAQSTPNIVGLALAANSPGGALPGGLDILIALVTDPAQKPVLDALNGRGQLTVFAPTDAAFIAVADALNGPAVISTEADARTFLLAADKALVRNVLLYHVTRGSRDAASVLGSSQIRMLNGQFAAVNAQAGTIDGAPIIATNLRASNGIVHVVSAVLVP